MQRVFDRGLAELKERLLKMGGLVEQMIHRAVESLVRRDGDLIAEVVDLEHQVNVAQIEIDNLAVRLLATQQPMAVDLRNIIACSRINSELERMGDQAINICDNTQFLLAEPELKPLIDIPIMATEVKQMVQRSLDSFVKRSVEQAQEVILSDDRVDALKDQIFRELLTYMMSDPSAIRRAISLILISRNLERIADHAVNVAEEVIYFVQGRDVRHPGESGQARPGPA